MIKELTQGLPDADREIFGSIGAWCVSKEVHAVLGVPVTSKAGDIWLIDEDDGNPRGFAQLRAQKNKTMHLRLIYGAVQPAATSERLARTAMAKAKATGAKAIYTNDRESAHLWPRLGFTFSPHRRQTFGRWEKTL